MTCEDCKHCRKIPDFMLEEVPKYYFNIHFWLFKHTELEYMEDGHQWVCYAKPKSVDVSHRWNRVCDKFQGV